MIQGKLRLIVPILLLAGATVGLRGQSKPAGAEWTTYGGDLASTRYSPLDQITKDNFNKLEIAWRFKTDSMGPRPEFNFQVTPLMVDGVVYTTAGTRRAVVALDAVTGEMKWMHSENEGKRGESAPRLLSGRGLAYWPGSGGQGDAHRLRHARLPDGRARRQDRRAGRRLRQERHRRSEDGRRPAGRSDHRRDRTARRRRSSPRTSSSSAPRTSRAARRRARTNEKGFIRGYDARTGKRLWIFHTIPSPGEFGNNTWEKDSWAYTGNAGVWAQMTIDEELGMVYLPVELPTGDYYGGNRPGNGLFGESVVALDLKTGVRKWHYQTRAPRHLGHGHPLRADPRRHHRRRHERSRRSRRPTKQGWVYVFDRTNGQPVWPIVERPVEKGDVPGEWYSPTQPFVDQAAGVRSPGRVARRSDRLHAGAARGRR